MELADLNTMFKKPFITSYGFIRLLFAKLLLAGKRNISKDILIKKIYDLSGKEQYQELLNDIGFNVHIDSIYSKEIELSISWLILSRIINIISEKDIIIFMDENLANNIVKEYDADVLIVMNDFMNDFLN